MVNWCISFLVLIICCLIGLNAEKLSFSFTINLRIRMVATQGMLGVSMLPSNFCVDISGNYSFLLNIPAYNPSLSSSSEIIDIDV